MLTIDNETILADTISLHAEFRRGILVSLVRKSDGAQCVQFTAAQSAPLQLVYAGDESVPLGAESGDRVVLIPINRHYAK